MRNIALLEWGPASLYYLQPREKIRVRTGWLENGPRLPPFLSANEDCKGNGDGILVRYALSAYEDLNSCIRNLRCCFGFPYPEYIGYLNTLTHAHRARREHEALLAGLRRWAIFGNIDAIVWIDYAKSNQPPGSFTMGPKDSRPFGKHHMELCFQGQQGQRALQNDEESEVAWSEMGEDDAGPDYHAHANANVARWNPSASLAANNNNSSNINNSSIINIGSSTNEDSIDARPSKLSDQTPMRGKSALLSNLAKPVLRARPQVNPHSYHASGAMTARTAPASAAARDLAQGGPSVVITSSVSSSAQAQTSRHQISGDSSLSARGPKPRTKNREILQEEFIPAHGSIYTRSIAPGPGYYGMGPGIGSAGPSSTSIGGGNGGDGLPGPTFGTRPPPSKKKASDWPAPGCYWPNTERSEQGKFGTFSKAGVEPPGSKARRRRGAGDDASYYEQSSGEFTSAYPPVSLSPSPKFSFGKLRRPF